MALYGRNYMITYLIYYISNYLIIQKSQFHRKELQLDYDTNMEMLGKLDISFAV